MNVSLPHQARRVDPFEARDQQSDPFKRARGEDVIVDPGEAVGRATVIVGEGDPHDVVLVEDDEGYVGYCDCDGFAFHEGELAGDCCTHLVALAMESVVNGGLIQTLDDVVDVQEASDEPDDTAEPEVVDADPDDDALEEEIASVQEPSAEVQRKGGYADPEHFEDDQAEAPTPKLDDPFAGALEDVDERFVMTLGGDPYIRREGWQRLARSEGYRLRRTMVTFQSETDSTLAECEAQVLDGDEVVAEATGTAHIDGEDMSDAVANLNELAETRAYSRALGWATGAGLSAVEVDASEEFDDDREVATDGGR